MANTIHRSKLFGGRPAAEVYAEDAWPGARCGGCRSSHVVLRVQVFIALADMSADLRHRAMVELALRRVHPVKTKRGTAVRWSEQFACSGCQASLERAAARGYSFAIVDIDRGPGPEVPIVGVISDLS